MLFFSGDGLCLSIVDPAKIPAVTPGRGCGRKSFECYAEFVDKSAPYIASPSFEELAAQQGVTPVGDFSSLMGKPSPEDESAEEFSAALREWRQEGARPTGQQ